MIEDESITTAGKQVLVIDRKDIDYMNGKRILIVDDVISTGGSLHAWRRLRPEHRHRCGVLRRFGGRRCSKRTDITFLAPLPLFFH